MQTGRVIARATVLIAALTLLSRLLGLGRESVLAYLFGTTSTADAFLVAFTIPYTFYGVVGMALTTVIVPLFAEYAAQGRREEASEVLSRVINAVFAVTSVLALLGIAGAPYIARVLGAGFQPETLNLTAQLTALMMPSIVFMSLAGVLGGILNANNIFGPPAFGSVAMNLAVILCALAGARWYGVYSLAGGVIAGSLCFVLVQLPALRHTRFRYRINIRLKDPAVRRVIILAAPVMIATSIAQVSVMIDRCLASGLSEGSIAALNYANKLIQLPQGLFVLAVATAIFPTLSRLVAGDRRSETAATLQKGIKAVLLLAIPGTVGLVVLREPVVALLFERGVFDARATAVTASALLFLSPGLAGLSLNLLLTRGFFAFQDTRTPLFASVVTVGVKVVFSLLLIRGLQHNGLALSTSIAAIANMLILSVFLQKRLPGLFDRSFLNFAGGVLADSVIMGLAVYLFDVYLKAHLGGGTLLLAGRVVADIIFGASVFVIAGLILRLGELQQLFKSLPVRSYISSKFEVK